VALLLIEADASLVFTDGTNALHSASRCGLIEVAEAAINKGLDVNQKSRGNTHPIQCAVQSGDLDMVTFLLERGAQVHKFQVHPLFGDEDAQNPFTDAWMNRDMGSRGLLLCYLRGLKICNRFPFSSMPGAAMQPTIIFQRIIM
jgi:ankyrin repeat protein